MASDRQHGRARQRPAMAGRCLALLLLAAALSGAAAGALTGAFQCRLYAVLTRVQCASAP